MVSLAGRSATFPKFRFLDFWIFVFLDLGNLGIFRSLDQAQGRRLRKFQNLSIFCFLDFGLAGWVAGWAGPAGWAFWARWASWVAGWLGWLLFEKLKFSPPIRKALTL